MLSIGVLPDGYVKQTQQIREQFHLACQVKFFVNPEFVPFP